jgi:hypothetical protein
MEGKFMAYVVMRLRAMIDDIQSASAPSDQALYEHIIQYMRRDYDKEHG